MPTNEILPFAITDTGTNLLSQADYVLDNQREIGNQPGVAKSRLVNKAMRQTSHVAAAFAQAISDLTGDDVLDDGDQPALVATIIKAIKDAANPVGVPYFWLGQESELPDDVIQLYGQELSRTGFPALFQHYGTIHGAGNGTTTFNVPDMRGVAGFGKDNMGGSAANKITNAVSSIQATTIGAKGGSQSVQAHTHANTLTDGGHSHTTNIPQTTGQVASSGGNNMAYGGVVPYTSSTSSSNVSITNASYGAGGSQNMPPAIIGLWVTRTGL